MCYKCIEEALLTELPPLQLVALCPSLLNIHPVQEPGKWVLEVSDDCDETTRENLEKLVDMAKTMLNAMGLSIIPWEFRVVSTSRLENEKQLKAALEIS